MATLGGGISRVSNSLQAFSLLSHLRSNTLRVFREQQRIASGERLLSISDDPIAAEKITRLTKALEGQEQILRNLRHADGQLAAADAAITDIHDLLIEAARIASEQAGSLQGAEERASQAVIVDSIIQQLTSVGNRQYQSLYLFGGRQVDLPPFTDDYGRVTFRGDIGDRKTLVDPRLAQAYNLVASELFDLRDPLSGGYVAFNALLSTDTRLSDLNGAQGAGLRFGPIQVTDVGAGVTFTTDFTGAETVGDVIARFNADSAAAGATLTMSISGTGLQIASAGGNIQIQDINNGTMAVDLGIAGTFASPLAGSDVDRRITVTTNISDLGPGFSLPNGVVITNGARSATVTFSGATTVGDLLNELNTADVGIRASISPDGQSFVIENLIAGTPLLIGENGGTDAEKLGIRTLFDGTLLSSVNDNRGIHTVNGVDDLQITDANGIQFGVNLDNAVTIADVIAAINTASAAAGSSIVASRSPSGGALRITGAAGPGAITVDPANLSPVAQELGIRKTGTATLLDGDNLYTYRQPGVFSALYRLRDALLADDSSEITEAGGDIQALQQLVANVQGVVGARSRAMRDRLQQTEDAVISTTIVISDLRDVDLTEAITKFQAAQTALQSTILTGSQSLNRSLLEFVR